MPGLTFHFHRPNFLRLARRPKIGHHSISYLLKFRLLSGDMRTSELDEPVAFDVLFNFSRRQFTAGPFQNLRRQRLGARNGMLGEVGFDRNLARIDRQLELRPLFCSFWRVRVKSVHVTWQDLRGPGIFGDSRQLPQIVSAIAFREFLEWADEQAAARTNTYHASADIPSGSLGFFGRPSPLPLLQGLGVNSLFARPSRYRSKLSPSISRKPLMQPG
jgi:hypothetical protein